jgi:hypothetical protein
MPELVRQWQSRTDSVPILCLAARWGAQQAWEQARQLWPEPICDRPPTKDDADDKGYVQVVLQGKEWGRMNWPSAAAWNSPWLHTPRWQPRQPTLQEQALKDLDELFSNIDPAEIAAKVTRIRRALEQAGEGVE